MTINENKKENYKNVCIKIKNNLISLMIIT